MTVEKPTDMQIIVAWRDNKWVVERNAAVVAAYAYRVHAIEHARTLAAEAAAQGVKCYLLIREQDGRWSERPCPRSPRRAAGG
ncbi:hypothetical protein [Phenylobacterium sp.]|uniref:hypothetical protein n=1 Tax=Phenylobacterium sp. TaxID=1871053 RepID=UPI002812255D|nr:hypothetical protein [Phenylobacterium sp.]